MGDRIIETKICIIGAGPAGATASLFLSKYGIDHLLIDKTSFPRDKVCGDALTIEVMNTLKLLDHAILEEMVHHQDFLPVWEMMAYTPAGKSSRIGFEEEKLPYAPFYTGTRHDFDHFLLQHAVDRGGELLSETQVVDISKDDGDLVTLKAKRDGVEVLIRAEVVLGADGSGSVVGRKLGNYPRKDLKHTYASVRTYFRLKEGQKVDSLGFYFLKEVLPGYIWVFPMPDGEVNVGIVVLSEHVQRTSMKIREVFYETLKNHVAFQDLFADAQEIGSAQGWDLPLNSKRKKLAGNRYLLLGDAGSMVEPFSGKGIGIAMIAGMLAAETIRDAVEKNRFDEEMLMQYHDAVYKQFSVEWRILFWLQKWYHHPARVNFLGFLYEIPLVKRLVNKGIQKAILAWM